MEVEAIFNTSLFEQFEKVLGIGRRYRLPLCILNVWGLFAIKISMIDTLQSTVRKASKRVSLSFLPSFTVANRDDLGKERTLEIFPRCMV